MPMPYDKWSYIYPPRPKTAVPYEDIVRYKDGRWMAQLKLNGTRNLIFVSPEGDVEFWNRHNEKHRAWIPTPTIIEAVRRQFACGKWVVLDSELLHSKHPDVKNTIYLFGALVLDSSYLVGESYESSYDRLAIVCGNPTTLVDGYGGFVSDLGGGLWLARMIEHDRWDEAWAVAQNTPIVEGVVLKRVKAKLEMGCSADNNGSWMIRCRKPTKNFQF